MRFTWKKVVIGFFIGLIGLILYSIFVFRAFFPLFPLFWNHGSVLITLHNNAELRPTLGFLTGFFIFRHTEEGFSLHFYDSYAVEPPSTPKPAPEILKKRFSENTTWQGWVFRDSNMSPFFSENAKQAISFLQADPQFSKEIFTGSISVDMVTIEYLIDAVGGVSFNDEIITSHNLFSVLEVQSKDFVPITKEAWLDRKSGVSDLGKKIIQSALIKIWKWDDIASAMEEMLNTQHILLFSVDSQMQQNFQKKQWTGVYDIPSASIPWGVSIANIGGKKSDRYIQKTVTSSFTVNEYGELEEFFRIRFSHEGTRNLHSDRYFAEVNLLRPKGSEIIKSNGEFKYFPEKKEDESIRFFFEIDEGSEKIFEIRIKYPERISASFINPLSFFIIPQPGEINLYTTLVFRGIADTSWDVIGCSKTKNTENITFCELPNTQTIINALWQEDTTPPLLEEILLKEDRKKLRVQFSEDIQSIPLSRITIEKENNSLIPESIIQESKAIEISFAEPIPQSSHKYIITIEDVQDIFGNIKLIQNVFR